MGGGNTTNKFEPLAPRPIGPKKKMRLPPPPPGFRRTCAILAAVVLVVLCLSYRGSAGGAISPAGAPVGGSAPAPSPAVPSIAAQALALGALPLSPGEAGKCWFHSQNPRKTSKNGNADQDMFKLLGGSIGNCRSAPAVTLPPSAAEPSVLCTCRAPLAADAFGLKFLEIGANDGVYLSNLLFFEAQMGWTGLCIEASPGTFKRLERNRPKCINSMSVISTSPEAATFFTIESTAPDTTARWESTISCMLGSNFCPDRAAAQAWWKRFPGTEMTEDAVPSAKLSTLFAQQGWNTFGWLSIDVEGAEDWVIETIDFARVHARYISYEGEHKKSAALLAKAGYVDANRKLGFDDTLWIPGPKAWAPAPE